MRLGRQIVILLGQLHIIAWQLILWRLVQHAVPLSKGRKGMASCRWPSTSRNTKVMPKYPGQQLLHIRKSLVIAQIQTGMALAILPVDSLVRDEDGSRHQVLGVGWPVVANVMVVCVVVVVLVPVVGLVVAHDADVAAAVEAAQPMARAIQVWHAWTPALVARAVVLAAILLLLLCRANGWIVIARLAIFLLMGRRSELCWLLGRTELLVRIVFVIWWQA